LAKEAACEEKLCREENSDRQVGMESAPNYYPHQWRVTKYDPAMRNEHGHFTGDEWIMTQEIGSVVDGKLFTKNEYLEMEDRYVNAAEEFFLASGLETRLQSCSRQTTTQTT
jgi:hypothetical protein